MIKALKRLAPAVGLGWLALAAPALASVDFSADPAVITETSPGVYSFVEAGFSGGAEVTGSFSGVDANGDGQISYFTNPPDPAYPLEVTNFSMTFTGNALVPAFSLDFAQLDNFNYQLGPTLGSTFILDNGLTEGIEASSFNRFYILGPGPAALCNGSEPCGGVMSIPEPGAWLLLLTGLSGLGAILRRARRAAAA